MDWDFDRFSEAVKVGVRQQEGRARQQKSLALFFNKASVGKIDKPTTLVDRHGRMLVWFFPDILCPGRTVSFPLTLRVILDILMLCRQSSIPLYET